MILRIIDETEKALSHDLYFAALNLALTLPDICGKAEYPNLRTGERYKKWYDENVGVTEKPPKCTEDEPEMPYLSGEVVYSLRCSLLHEGNPNLQKNGKHPIPIDRFSLVIQSEQPFRIYGGEGSSVLTSSDGTEVCALPGFVDSKNEEKTERNAGYLVVSHSGGGMLRQGTRKGIRRTPANRGMRAHWVVKGLDISEDVCHGMCP